MRNPNPPLRHALWIRMRDRALLDRLPKMHAMRTHADAMEEAFTGMHLQMHDSIRKFVDAWNIARQTWQQYTGESLL